MATQAPQWFDGVLRDWQDRWGAPALTDVSITFSRRMTRKFGYYRPDNDRIVLAERLLYGDEAILRETLCHEAAHAAVHRRYGPGRRPHGPEWRQLMVAAGYPPTRTAPPDPLAAPYRPLPKRYLHYCPMCLISRPAARRMRRWRCVPCRQAGRPGRLHIAVLP